MSTGLKVLRIVNTLLLLAAFASFFYYAHTSVQRVYPFYKERALQLCLLMFAISYLVNIITCYRVGKVVYNKPVKYTLLAILSYFILLGVIEIDLKDYAGPYEEPTLSPGGYTSSTRQSYSSSSYASSTTDYPTRTVTRVNSCGMVHHHQEPIPDNKPQKKWRKVRMITPQRPGEHLIIEDRE